MPSRSRFAPHVPYVPSQEQRLRGLEQVRTSVDQLASLLSHLQSAPATNGVLREALLNHLIHCLPPLLFFLESEQRTVHYAGGIRQENPDILALDYGFPPARLPIDDDARRTLADRATLLSYAPEATHSNIPRWELLTLTIPILRRCAAFAAHVTSDANLLLDNPTSEAWNRLLLSLVPFTTPNRQPRVHSPKHPS